MPSKYTTIMNVTTEANDDITKVVTKLTAFHRWRQILRELQTDAANRQIHCDQ